MHSNPRFNIVQSGIGFNAQWVVIEGKRMPGGYMETGAKVLTKPMSRDAAIEVADKLELDIAQ